VLAAESRLTLTAKSPSGPLHVNFDNASKLLACSTPNTSIGVVTYGLAAVGLRTAQSYIPEFEAELRDERLSVQEFAELFREFFLRQWEKDMPSDYKSPSMTFVVAGFNPNEPYGRVFLMELPKAPTPVEQSPAPGEFGITWGGQREIVDRLVQGYDHRAMNIIANVLKLKKEQRQEVQDALKTIAMQIPLAAMPLQDCVNLATLFVRTTIAAQTLTVGLRGCGGPIDVAVITRREGLRFIQRKEISVET